MARSQYDLQGVGSSVEFGKGGARMVAATGQLECRANSGGALAKMKAADGVAADDVATVGQLGGASDWASVLAVGNSSGANDPEIADGRTIKGVDSGVANGGSYTVRAGNYTAGTGSFDGGEITVQGGGSVSTSNGSNGGAATFAGGDNLVASAATGGKGTFRGGNAGIGGECEVAGGTGLGSNAGGLLTCHGGENTDTGAGGAGVFRGGDCVGGSGSDPGGTATLRGGNARGTGTSGDVRVQGGQPGGTSGGRTGRIFINTDSLSGTNRQTGEIQVKTGDANTTQSTQKSGDLTLGTGAATNAGNTGDASLTTGDANDGATGDLSIGTGTSTSNDSFDRTGNLTLFTGDRLTNAGGNAPTGSISLTVGTANNSNATSPAGDFTAKAGDNNNVSGLAGDASLIAGFAAGPGTGKVRLVSRVNGTADDGHVSTDTQDGSFSGSDHRIVTKGLEVGAGAGPVTAVAIQGPAINGQNVKIKVWATASDNSNPGDQLGHLIEQVFIRNVTTQAMTAHTNNTQGTGTWPPTVFVTLAISGSQILVQANALTLSASRWMFWVEWQIGGMAV